MSGFYLRGAFVQFMDTFLVPLPNVIIFQFNPETMTHTWTPAQGSSDEDGANPLAVKGMPGESFSFTLALDSSDMIADGSVVAAGIAESTGIYTRLAALEMLQYPVSPGANGLGELLGTVSAAVGLSDDVKRPVPESQLPTVLFVWGPGRILPVRITSLVITETLYDSLLNPTHADAAISLEVLTPDELKAVTGPLREIAQGAYVYSQGLRQALAVLNLANSTESVIGMLPL